MDKNFIDWNDAVEQDINQIHIALEQASDELTKIAKEKGYIDDADVRKVLGLPINNAVLSN